MAKFIRVGFSLSGGDLWPLALENMVSEIGLEVVVVKNSAELRDFIRVEFSLWREISSF